MDEGSISGATSVRGLALTVAATTKDTAHDNVDSTTNNSNNNSVPTRYLSGGDCQNVSSSGVGIGGSSTRVGSSDLSASAMGTTTITHIKQSPTSPSPMSSSTIDGTTQNVLQQQQQQQQQHPHRQSDTEVLYGATATSAIVAHPLDMQHHQQRQQQQQTHLQQQQQQQHQQQSHHHHQHQQHLQRLSSSLSNIHTTAAADSVSSSRIALSHHHPIDSSLLSERPPPPPYSSSAAVMASKAFHAGSCADNSMEAISGDEPPVATSSTSRLSAYEQFLKLSAQEYAAASSSSSSAAADNAAVLNLSSIGKSTENDLMLRHTNVAAVMAAAAAGNVGVVDGGSVGSGGGIGIADGCERN